MANKVYEAKTLESATKARAEEYQELKRQMNQVKQNMQALVDLDGFHGKGAEAIKGFYQAQIDVVNEWIQLIDKNIAFMKGIPGTAEDFDLAGDTVVQVPFVEEDICNSLTRAKEMVSEQHRELKGTFSQIDDLVSLTPFSKESFHSQIEDAEKKRSETVKEVNELDRALKEEYEMLESDEAIVTTLYQQLLASTGSGGNVTPIHFDAKAYHNSEIYKLREENAARQAEYLQFKKDQIEQRRLAKEQEELENRPWYEKAWDATCTFTGEVTGYYDYKRATEGIDPVTGEKLSTAERVAAGAMAAAGFIPVVGWAGRAIKGGSAIYKTAKGLNAANHALDAYKSTKGMDILQKSEMGIYGLVAANGFGEAATGRDMFGNKLSDEKRTQSLTNALGITALGGLARYADHVQTRNLPNTKAPYSNQYVNNKINQAKNALEKVKRNVGQFEVPVKFRVQQLATPNNIPTAAHFSLEKKSVSEIAQAFSMRSGGGRGGAFNEPKRVRDIDGIPRILEIVVRFKQNPKHDAKEFERQLKDQEKGINELTVDEFTKNRDKYIKNGRALEGDAAQKLARKKALQDKIDELREQGLSYQEAEEKANKWIKGQAALHNPDQIAGGNPLHIGGMGDKRINSSIGSQWRTNIVTLDKEIRDRAKHLTEEERKETYLNIKLTHK
ncbi:T7SS effector LXG polymorphic toxin [Bacillus gobiensis]|uniref:T7SS effector LXG polymorphic toxin n=1 Tax=Bacillus gobiensis TaxID=1441095 RepID=UPI003D226263